MDFDWQKQDGVWVSLLPEGKAIITEKRRRGFGVPIGGEWLYAAYLHDHNGVEVESYTQFYSFEDAVDWCSYRRVAFHTRRKQASERDFCLQALRIVEQALPASLPDVYHARVRTLQQYLIGAVEYDRFVPLLGEMLTNWTQTETMWTHPTTHGQAIIWIEQASASSIILGSRPEVWYHAKIQAVPEVELVLWDRFADWQSASDELYNVLNLLERPTVDKQCIDVVVFSIKLYQYMLRNIVDNSVIVGLETLNETLAEAFAYKGGL